MTSTRRAITRRVLLVRAVTSQLIFAIMVCTTSGQTTNGVSQISQNPPLANPTTNIPPLSSDAYLPTAQTSTSFSMSSSGLPAPSSPSIHVDSTSTFIPTVSLSTWAPLSGLTATSTTTARPATNTSTSTTSPITSTTTKTTTTTTTTPTTTTTTTPTTKTTNANTTTITNNSQISSTISSSPSTAKGIQATTNITSTTLLTTTTPPPPAPSPQRVLIACSNSFTVVFGPSATTASVAVSRSSATTTPGTTGTTGTTKPINNSLTTNPSIGTAGNQSVTTIVSVTKLPDVAYAPFLVDAIARTANISNTSRVVNMSVFGDGNTNQLVIQFTILDGTVPTAAEAVANLNRLLGSTNTARRKRRAPTNSYQLIDMYNQTLIPIKVVSWTDAGPCPNSTCRNGGVCRGRTNGTLYCDCRSPDLQAPLCDVATSAQSQNQPLPCVRDVKCIVPAVVVPVVGVLLIVVIVVVIVIVVRRRHNESGFKKNYGQRRAVSAVDAEFTPAHLDDTDKRHSSKNGGTVSSRGGVGNRYDSIRLNGSSNNTALVDNSGTVSSISMVHVASDDRATSEIMSY